MNARTNFYFKCTCVEQKSMDEEEDAPADRSGRDTPTTCLPVRDASNF